MREHWKWEVQRGAGEEVPCHSMTTPGGVLCRWWEGPGVGPFETERSDASLLAAASDMRAALLAIDEWYRVNGGRGAVYTDVLGTHILKAREALAKSEERQLA